MSNGRFQDDRVYFWVGNVTDHPRPFLSGITLIGKYDPYENIDGDFWYLSENGRELVNSISIALRGQVARRHAHMLWKGTLPGYAGLLTNDENVRFIRCQRVKFEINRRFKPTSRSGWIHEIPAIEKNNKWIGVLRTRSPFRFGWKLTSFGFDQSKPLQCGNVFRPTSAEEIAEGLRVSTGRIVKTL